MPTNRTGELLLGQLFDVRTALRVPFTEQVHNFPAGEGATPVENEDAATEGIPMDAGATKVKVFDLSGFLAEVKDFYVLTAGKRNLNGSLPDTLTAIAISWNTGGADGAGTGTTDYGEALGAGGVSSSPTASAESSRSVVPSMTPTIIPPNAPDVPVMEYSFYVGTQHTRDSLRARVTRFAVSPYSCTITIASPGAVHLSPTPSNGQQVSLSTTGALPTGYSEDTIYYVVSANPSAHTCQLALTSGGTAINLSGTQSGSHSIRLVVADWPRFNTRQVVVTMFGSDVAVRGTATASTRLSQNEDGSSWGKSGEHASSYSKQVSLSTRREVIPATIHGTITASGTSLPSGLTATATASVTALAISGTGTTATAVGASAGDGTPPTINATGSITLSGNGATTPAAIPTSGLYFYDSQLGLTEYGQAYVTVTLVDMSYFA